MPKRTILLADNDLDFLTLTQEFLEGKGYELFLATDVAEARRVLEQKPVALAILDFRLSNDDDAKDRSGLLLAQEAPFRSVPKIILTKFPTFQGVRDALRLAPDELPLAVDFLDKSKGLEDMLEAVERAFAQHVRINYALKLTFTEPQSFASMARQILDGELSKEGLNDRAMELEELLRHLFYENTEVFLDTVAMHRPGQLVARVRARHGIGEKPQYLLKCGTSDTMQQEEVAYEMRHVLVQKWSLQRENSVRTVHFGAIVYAAPTGLQLESALWLAEYYRWHTMEEICRTMNDLFGKAYSFLYTQPCPAEERSIDLLYREHLGLTSARHQEQAFREAMRELAEYAQLQHMVTVNVEPEARTITFLFPDGTEVSHRDPTSCAYRNMKLLGPRSLCRLALGNMDGYNVLVDHEGRAWVTDFGNIGPAPTLSDFVALEAKIRFEWIDTTDLSQLHDFEVQLVTPNAFEVDLEEQSGQSKDLKKALRIIDCLRKQATRVPGADPLEYHIGMLFHTVRLILADVSLDCKLHALLAAAMTCGALEDWGVEES